jgi:hypothetical protein
MMKTNMILGLAAGAALVALLIGIGIGRSGKSELEERANNHEELAAAVTALSDRVGALEGGFDTVDGRFEEMAGQIGSLAENISGQDQKFAELSDKIGSVTSQVANSVSEFGAKLTSTVSEQVVGLEDKIAQLGTPVQQKEAPKGQSIMPGETLMLGEGAGRIFLSSVSADKGSARVAVNGTQVATLTLDSPVEAGDCTITLTGIDAPGATIDSQCGGGSGENTGSGSASGSGSGSGSGDSTGSDTGANAEPVGLGEGTEIAMASAAGLGDGKLRVYLSRLDHQSQSARVAINGTGLIDLKLGEAVEAGDCKVTLTGMSESSASIQASC